MDLCKIGLRYIDPVGFCAREADPPAPEWSATLGDPLRIVQLEGEPYILAVWYSRPDPKRHGSILAYTFWTPSGPLFSGDEYGPPPSYANDSDEALRELIGFISLRVGDTDDDYFTEHRYDAAQLAWAARDNYAAETVSLWQEREGEGDVGPMPFVDLDECPRPNPSFVGPFCRPGAHLSPGDCFGHLLTPIR